MTKFGWLEEISCKRSPSNNWLELDVKSIKRLQNINNSIQTSEMDANTNPSNRWGGMTLKSLQPCLLPMPNTTIGHSWLLHYNCQKDMWWPNLYDWKRNLAREACPTIDLNLMWNQSTCLDASITLTKLPIMMQTQIQAHNMRWGERTFKSLQPCLLPMSNTTIGHSWLYHYNYQTGM